MMFLKRKAVLLIFKFISLLIVTLMLFVFLKVLYYNEKISPEVKKIENQEVTGNEIRSKDNFFTMNFISVYEFVDSTEKEEKCYSQYVAYYLYALILGAYINIKRLYKMGPI
jgi:hypothetical protein